MVKRAHIYKVLTVTTLLLAALLPLSANAACTDPAGVAGEIDFNADYSMLQYCDDVAWIPMYKDYYWAEAVTFDGTNDYLTRGADLTGLADGSSASGSFWFRRNGSFGVAQRVISAEGDRYTIHFTAGDILRITGNTSAGAQILRIDAPSAITDSNWHHIMFSYDLNQSCPNNTTTGPGCYIYIDGVAQAVAVTGFTSGTIDFTRTNHSIGSVTDGSGKFNGDFADFWMDFNNFIDFSDAATRAKFIDGRFKPVNLGANGEHPTGAAPEMFFSGALNTWQNNDGTGGGFTENGALTAAATTPSVNLIAGGNGLVGHWKLDETIGASITDSSGTGNNGTWTDDVNNDVAEETVTGTIGSALLFDDWDHEVIVNNHSTLAISDDTMTISAWVRKTSNNNIGAIFIKGQDGVDGYQFGIGTAGCGASQINFSKFWINHYCFDGVPLDTSWHHYSVVVDSTGMRAYVDGAQTDSDGDTQSIVPSTEDGVIGFLGGGNTAEVDDVRIYNRALSASEVLALYQDTGCTSPYSPSGVMIYNTDANVMQFCDGQDWLGMGPTGDGGAGCSNPAGAAGTMVYNAAYNAMQYCEGDQWVAVGKDSAPTEGLIGHWKLDESSGTTANDFTTNNNDGTMQNALSAANDSVPGRLGNALNLDGTNDSIETALQIDTSGASSYTFAAWTRPENDCSAEDYCFIITTDAGNYEWSIVQREGGNWHIYNVTGEPTVAPVQLGVWQHLVSVYNHANNTWTFYLNGTETASGSIASYDGTNNDVTIGGTSYDDYYFGGDLDDVRIYNRALSAEEVKQLFLSTQ